MRCIVIPILILAGCQINHNYTIEGHLPDNSYDGGYMYLVPLEDAAKERVDSAIIKEGMFRFEGFVKTPEIFILRTRPLLRLKLQELLVVKEPGKINVAIGTTSFVGGTVLNDSLQVWKQKKLDFDRHYYELKHQYQMRNDSSRKEIKQKLDNMNARNIDFNFSFIKNNRKNVVGKMVYKIMKNTFTPEQKRELFYSDKYRSDSL